METCKFWQLVSGDGLFLDFPLCTHMAEREMEMFGAFQSSFKSEIRVVSFSLSHTGESELQCKSFELITSWNTREGNVFQKNLHVRSLVMNQQKHHGPTYNNDYIVFYICQIYVLDTAKIYINCCGILCKVRPIFSVFTSHQNEFFIRSTCSSAFQES